MKTVRQLVGVLPKAGSEEKELTACLTLWKNSLADYADATLVSRATVLNVHEILSDDADVATFNGITLFTANQKVVEAAVAAKKCLNAAKKKWSR